MGGGRKRGGIRNGLLLIFDGTHGVLDSWPNSPISHHDKFTTPVLFSPGASIFMVFINSLTQQHRPQSCNPSTSLHTKYTPDNKHSSSHDGLSLPSFGRPS